MALVRGSGSWFWFVVLVRGSGSRVSGSRVSAGGVFLLAVCLRTARILREIEFYFGTYRVIFQGQPRTPFKSHKGVFLVIRDLKGVRGGACKIRLQGLGARGRWKQVQGVGRRRRQQRQGPRATKQNHEPEPRSRATKQSHEPEPRSRATNQSHEPEPRARSRNQEGGAKKEEPGRRTQEAGWFEGSF